MADDQKVTIIRSYPEMIHILKLADKDFKITVTDMINEIEKKYLKVDGNKMYFNRESQSIKKTECAP